MLMWNIRVSQSKFSAAIEVGRQSQLSRTNVEWQSGTAPHCLTAEFRDLFSLWCVCVSTLALCFPHCLHVWHMVFTAKNSAKQKGMHRGNGQSVTQEQLTCLTRRNAQEQATNHCKWKFSTHLMTAFKATCREGNDMQFWGVHLRSSVAH